MKSWAISPNRPQLVETGRRTASVTGLSYRFRHHSLPHMELITILNRWHRFRGFVYQHAYFSADKKSIEVAVRPRKGSAAVCSLPFAGVVTTNSPNGALNSFPCGGFSSSFCTPCVASTVAAAALSP